jgi:hypothetical protein
MIKPFEINLFDSQALTAMCACRQNVKIKTA